MVSANISGGILSRVPADVNKVTLVTLLDRANEFIKSGGDEIELLIDCIRAQNLDGLVAVQRLYEDMYGGTTYNFELKAPAALSLVCWGDAGVDALLEGQKRTPTSKNTSLTVQILSGLASGGVPNILFIPAEIKDAVTTSTQSNSALSDFARQRLTEFMLSLPDDDEASNVAGSALQKVSFPESDGKAAKEVFAALASRWLTVGTPILAKYRGLINDFPDEEPKFQAFFEEVPQLLDPLAVLVWAQPDFHGIKEPDFIVKRADGTYVVIEIETPAKLLITSSLQVSAQVTQAVTQAMQYRSFLVERFQEARAHFPDFRDPDCLVIIGMERDLTLEQRRALSLENEHRKGVRIVGFDWIADRAETMVSV